MMISALEVFNLAHIGNSLFAKELLAQHSSSADCGADFCLWKAKEDGLYLYNFAMGTDVKMHNWEILCCVDSNSHA